MLGRLLWNLQYLRGRPPWDTGITPPELVELVEGGLAPPGRALDIGCGTGTNAIYLAQHGFEVVGTDVAWLAIRKARRKAREASVDIAFHTGDATKLGTPGSPLAGESFDLALDIGCFHSVAASDRVAYRSMLRRMVRAGGRYLLYAWGPRVFMGRDVGIAQEEMEGMLAADFEPVWIRGGEERGSPSFWYLFERRKQQ
jgi:SAM-dependent methyltransferase